MKRTLPALVVAVLGAGLALAGTAAPASAAPEATTNTVVGTCDVLSLDLAGYAVEAGAPAVYTPGTPAVDEVSHTDYEYERWSITWFGWPYATGEKRFTHKWVGERDIYDWGYYKYAGVSQKHVEVEGKPEVAPLLVTPAIPANAAPNTVSVVIDGETVVDAAAFGEGYAPADFALDKGTPGTETYGQHTYSVSVTAYEGSDAAPTTSVVAEGTTSCATGEYAATATIDTDTTCGTAVVSLTNTELLASKVNGTYSAIIWVDGKVQVNDILAVFENTSPSKTYSFAEDSGDHVVEVRTGPAHGDVLLEKVTVDTDCAEEPAPPVDPSITVTGALVQGGEITVTGEDFSADTEYEIELHSTPQAIASVTTDGEGAFSGTGTIAADTPAGVHEIVVLAEGEEPVTVEVTIEAAPTAVTPGTGTPGTGTTAATGTTPAAGTSAGLADTGFDAMPLAALAAALLALAGLAFGARRAIRVKG